MGEVKVINDEKVIKGYVVSEKCVGCGNCMDVCTAQCIDIYRKPVYIDQSRCVKCGNCYRSCTPKAIFKIG